MRDVGLKIGKLLRTNAMSTAGTVGNKLRMRHVAHYTIISKKVERTSRYMPARPCLLQDVNQNSICQMSHPRSLVRELNEGSSKTCSKRKVLARMSSAGRRDDYKPALTLYTKSSAPVLSQEAAPIFWYYDSDVLAHRRLHLSKEIDWSRCHLRATCTTWSWSTVGSCCSCDRLITLYLYFDKVLLILARIVL